jgi:hypothetical protein
VIVTAELAATHGPAPSGSFVVKVSTTVPVVMDGVYVDVSEEGSEKLPEAAVQFPLVAVPPTDPDKFMVPPAQTVCAAPAFAVAAAFTVIVTDEVAGRQGPPPSGSFDVSVSCTVPVVIVGV